MGATAACPLCYLDEQEGLLLKEACPMKHVTLACAFLIATSCFAQNNAPQSPKPDLPLRILPGVTLSAGQEGCPVKFTNIDLKTKGSIMLVHSDNASDGDLAFQYQNQSGKTIQSIAVNVGLKIKENVYALDTTDFNLSMVLTGKGVEETLPLNIHGYVYGVRHVTLERVSYTDGSNWMASAQNSCKYEKIGTSEKIIELQ
jgi:hypothetical protein